ncbi:CIC11C00000002199 [Sungouiella intermedia]|uniref:CIC11C00000002199 n=1 Tax=Sungouiella intermedia TaxID=45354 RepID=A0A1L0GKU3_9ASCO|nr:CIC11C00000002199 [[Candida] intermedia]
MSLNTILQKIQQKGRIKSVLPTGTKPVATPSTSRGPIARPSSDRPVDPVVARLKAARKAEKEKKEQELREKKGLQPKKETKPRAKSLKPTLSSRTSAQSTRAPAGGDGGARNGKGAKPRMAGMGSVGLSQLVEKKLKMSFSELMKKASLIDQSKMSIAIKQKTKSPENVGPKRPPRSDDDGRGRNGDSGRVSQSVKPFKSDRPRPGSAPGGYGSRISAREPRESRDSRDSRESREREIRPEIRTPLPTRKPSEKLQAQLKGRPSARKDEVESDEDDWGSFIASDEEEEQQSYGGDYDRDEIWSMFNKGRKRSYYDKYDDEDSDDMEATGAEIFEEEQRSKKRALEEDMREMKEEQRLAALKQARKAKLGKK